MSERIKSNDLAAVPEISLEGRHFRLMKEMNELS
uniref:Bm144 n=1 Tax=Brugia malayi TaxID=6279 RepID=A0A1I9FZV0_BRUMA|nr:Bm144 [Brugia malayi]